MKRPGNFSAEPSQRFRKKQKRVHDCPILLYGACLWILLRSLSRWNRPPVWNSVLILTREKDQQAWAAWICYCVKKPALLWGKDGKEREFWERAGGKWVRLAKTPDAWVMPLTEGRWQNPLENFMYASWDNQKVFLIRMSRSRFSKFLFIL